MKEGGGKNSKGVGRRQDKKGDVKSEKVDRKEWEIGRHI